MFKKTDYLEYFKELYDIEIEMEHEAKRLIGLINDPEITSILEKVKGDECRHAKLVKELIGLV